MPTEIELLSQLAREIVEATERFCAGDCREDELPTSMDLARKFGYRLDTVKKKLRVLKQQDAIQPISMTPKRYRFNTWVLKAMDDDHPLFPLFGDAESPHFIETAALVR